MAGEANIQPQTAEAPAFVTVTILNSGETCRCRTDESLIEGLRRMGKRGVPIGCRNGGCSVCRIEIVSGRYAAHRKMSREYVSDEDLAAGRVLACCVKPLSALEILAIGKMGKALAASAAGEVKATGAERP